MREGASIRERSTWQIHVFITSSTEIKNTLQILHFHFTVASTSDYKCFAAIGI